MTREKIIITGASSGLGEGMAREFARRGRSLGLAARRLDRLEALAAELEPAAGKVAVAQLDVTDLDAVPVAFEQLATELGGVDRVIVNAGLGKGARIGTGKAAENLETVQTNLVGALAQIEAAMEIFRRQQSGHLVLVSSMSAVRGLPKAQAAYSASKAGLSALGQGLQAELAGSPIKVTVLLPGYIETDINKGVKTSMLTDTDTGVAAMVAAIESERARAAVPSWPWTPISWALRYLPDAVTARMV
ncbi:SDR family oxidoreductase [Gordonia sp. (in: high G+C Gram-positive bacteria)]|uniref:SDR family oxidoreductase n=1 Tax=Gordonia sp. (in: high G+C Gram-positive bacteria) TaxID=84139 RepID=UPI00169E1C35|nr:SDR family oxidoreductase [Gordonia sp. (in: high G+C Gram-positive bacteria)]NLG46029.1 SDR family oxidoreductase [Gordonia sp. (in: high G+C Gram-positive bacteria)]